MIECISKIVVRTQMCNESTCTCSTIGCTYEEFQLVSYERTKRACVYTRLRIIAAHAACYKSGVVRKLLPVEVRREDDLDLDHALMIKSRERDTK